MAVTWCHFDQQQRPFIWIQAPEIIFGPIAALVDTGFNATVLLPIGRLVHPVTSQAEGLATRSTGEQTPLSVITTRIVFGEQSRMIACGLSQSAYAVVGVLFLESFRQTLLFHKPLEKEPVGVLIDDERAQKLLLNILTPGTPL